jgi:hypothetical protein
MVQPYRSKRVIFLGEHDGPAERDLKAALNSCFVKNEEVNSAYLTRISLFETPGTNVALCIYPQVNSSETLLQCIGASFSKLFNAVEHLDILFLEDKQKLEVDAVAKPFFDRRTLNPNP